MAWVGVGANLGDACATVRWACERLAALAVPGSYLASGLWRTAPWQAQGPDYVNAVVRLCSLLSAPDLLTQLQNLEQQAQRQRPYRNAPRTLDLDLLFYGDARIASPALHVPHPRWAERAFVLRPLAQISPERVSAQALAAVADQRATLL
jgi:2-amino-4-hydroxy-6-hydroxymethyldihydropteridine diphosphokinase